MLPMFQGVFRSMCLDVVLSQADLRASLYQELKGKGFHDMLKFRCVGEGEVCVCVFVWGGYWFIGVYMTV